MANVKVQSSNEVQMSNPPNPPLLKSVRLATEGGEGGLSIDFELCHSFGIWIFLLEPEAFDV